MMDSSARRVYLITDAYPYGPGEKTFVEPEIEYFASRYELTVVSMARADEVSDVANLSRLPDGVRLLHYEPSGQLRRLASSLSHLHSALWRDEVCAIRSERGPHVKWETDSLKYYGNALDIHAWLASQGVFDEPLDTLVYCYWMRPASLAVLVERALGSSVRVICRVHGFDLYAERYRNDRQPFHRSTFAAFDQVVFACEAARRYAVETYGIADDQRRYPVCRLGTEAGRAQTREDGHVFTVVSCAHAIALKRIDLTIRSLALLRGRFPLRWVHFGGGVELESLRQLARELGVPADFRGQVPFPKIRAFYEQEYVDLFLTTSSSEGGCPVSIQEAMAYGIPIVGTDVGGVPEEIEGNGELLPKDPAPEQVARVIERIHGLDSSRVDAMRARSMELWGERFDRRKNLELVGDLVASAFD